MSSITLAHGSSHVPTIEVGLADSSLIAQATGRTTTYFLPARYATKYKKIT